MTPSWILPLLEEEPDRDEVDGPDEGVGDQPQQREELRLVRHKPDAPLLRGRDDPLGGERDALDEEVRDDREEGDEPDAPAGGGTAAEEMIIRPRDQRAVDRSEQEGGSIHRREECSGRVPARRDCGGRRHRCAAPTNSSQGGALARSGSGNRHVTHATILPQHQGNAGLGRAFTGSLGRTAQRAGCGHVQGSIESFSFHGNRSRRTLGKSDFPSNGQRLRP